MHLVLVSVSSLKETHQKLMRNQTLLTLNRNAVTMIVILHFVTAIHVVAG